MVEYIVGFSGGFFGLRLKKARFVYENRISGQNKKRVD